MWWRGSDGGAGSACVKRKKEGKGGDSPRVARGPCGPRQTVNTEKIYGLLCCCSQPRERKIQTHLSY